MSDTMLIGVLRMPYDLFWTDTPLARLQHNARRLEAADELEKRAKEITRLRERVEELEKAAGHMKSCEYCEGWNIYAKIINKATQSAEG